MQKETIHYKSEEGKVTLAAFLLDDVDMEMVQKFASAAGVAHETMVKGDIQTATDYLKNHKSPTLLMVEIPSAAEAPKLLDALADVCDPDTKVITVGAINEYSFYCWLTEIGIFSYLLKPLTFAMLEGVYKKATEPVVVASKEEKKAGTVIAMLGARGGVGTSALSLNLAGAFAELSPRPVALVDVDSHAGTVALTLDIEPSRGLREAMEKPDRIDSMFVERVMIKPVKNLSVLCAEDPLHEHFMPHEQAASYLLAELKNSFGMVILDIPRQLTPHTMNFLKKADKVIVVSELSLLSLRDTLRIQDMFREVLKLPPPLIVLNRTGMMPKHEMHLADFEKGVNMKTTANIPFAPDAFMQVSSDIPAIKMKSHAAMKAVYGLAYQLVPAFAPKESPEKKSGFKLFKPKT